jgi:hypothetical protein
MRQSIVDVVRDSAVSPQTTVVCAVAQAPGIFPLEALCFWLDLFPSFVLIGLEIVPDGIKADQTRGCI